MLVKACTYPEAVALKEAVRLMHFQPLRRGTQYQGVTSYCQTEVANEPLASLPVDQLYTLVLIQDTGDKKLLGQRILLCHNSCSTGSALIKGP